jgi:hypothetical protein
VQPEGFDLLSLPHSHQDSPRLRKRQGPGRAQQSRGGFLVFQPEHEMTAEEVDQRFALNVAVAGCGYHVDSEPVTMRQEMRQVLRGAHVGELARNQHQLGLASSVACELPPLQLRPHTAKHDRHRLGIRGIGDRTLVWQGRELSQPGVRACHRVQVQV